MNKYLLFDEQYTYHWRDERQQKAVQLGFECISQCTVTLYRKHKSASKVGQIIGVSLSAILYELHQLKKFGIDIAIEPKGAPIGSARNCKNITDKQVIQLYKKHGNKTKVARLLKTSFYFVYDRLQKNNIRGGRKCNAWIRENF